MKTLGASPHLAGSHPGPPSWTDSLAGLMLAAPRGGCCVSSSEASSSQSSVPRPYTQTPAPWRYRLPYFPERSEERQVNGNPRPSHSPATSPQLCSPGLKGRWH